MTPCYIIIRGPLGVGKSTISIKLAKILDAKPFAMDDILHDHKLDKVDPELGTIPPRNFSKAIDIILPEVKRYLGNGTIVIFDGCFYHKENIIDLKNKLAYEAKIFTLKAPVETCIKRDRKRDLSYGEGAAQAVHNLVSRFDAGTVIKTEGKSIEETLNEILKHLP
ncbi:MAG: AAA family ATPase [Candidatus Gracilibacteria bacterium]|nr:AAA family ATPase [Candidatus Gracilibacteria bacterium]